MKIKTKILFTILFTFCIILFNNKVCATFEISNFKIDAIVDEKGDMLITETVNYYTNETVNGVTREITTKNNKNTKNSADNLNLIKVMVDGTTCSQIETGKGNLGDSFVYEYQRSNNNYNIKLYTPFNTSTKEIKYNYVLRNVGVQYNDISEIYWNFIGDKWDCNIEKLEINITLPKNAANKTSYVFGHGSDKGTFTKNGNYITLNARDIKAFQAIDARILFAKDALNKTTKIINKSVLDKYINEEEGMSLKTEKTKVIGNFTIKDISIIFIIIIIISAVYMYIKYDKEYVVDKVKYYREIPFGLEPELLQYFYYGKIVSNSYYVAILNLVKLGVYRLEKSVNKVGKEVQKIIYNDKHNIKLKEYQKDIEKSINGYLQEDEKGEKSIDLVSLGTKMSNSTGSGYKQYEKNLKAEKQSLVGNVQKASKKLPIILLILVVITVGILGIITQKEEVLGITVMMAFLSFIYSMLFISTQNIGLANLFLLLHATCFFAPVGIVLIINDMGLMFVAFILSFIFFIYTGKIKKFSKEERQIIEYVKGLRRYIKDFSLLKDKENLDYINLWEDYFILAIALKLNNKIVNYFYNYGKEQINSNLGNSMTYTSSFNDFNYTMYNTFYSYKKAYDLTRAAASRSSSSSYSGSSGGFSGGSSSGGGGGRRRRR